MTNEEKIREILECPCPTKIRDCGACFDRNILLGIAAWKEQQMIEKACEFLKTHNRGQLCEQLIKAMEE